MNKATDYCQGFGFDLNHSVFQEVQRKESVQANEMKSQFDADSSS